MTVATGSGFIALGLRVNQLVKSCCCGIGRGESLENPDGGWQPGVYPWLCIWASWWLFGIAHLCTSVTERFPLRSVGVFLKQNTWGSVSVSLARSESRLKQECGEWEDVFVALVKLRLETISVTFRDSIFVLPLQLSLLCLPFFFFFLLFICVLLTFVPCPSLLCPRLRCFEAAPTGGRQTPFPRRGVPALPRGWGAARPRPAGGPRRERLVLGVIRWPAAFPVRC